MAVHHGSLQWATHGGSARVQCLGLVGADIVQPSDLAVQRLTDGIPAPHPRIQKALLQSQLCK